jgi:putative transposase
MNFEFVLAGKAVWPVTVMCEVLRVSRSGYYAWQGRPASAREQADAELLVEIKAAHAVGRRHYGSPRVHLALRKSGTNVGKKRVARLMRREGIVAERRRKFSITTDSKHEDPIADNVLQREFKVALPNRIWVTDVTYVSTLQGWLYLAAILDLCSRRVVGWATSAHNDRGLALKALRRAQASRKPRPGLLHHSDRGCVYASAAYRQELSNLEMVPSMSRKGDCWDNAVAESFFATIKGEMLDQESFQTRAEATAAIADYIDTFYNVIRLHSSIGYLSPIEFELALNLKSQRQAA